MKPYLHKLSKAYIQVFKTHPESLHELPRSGSERQYIRFNHPKYQILGVYNPCIEENKAFLNYSRQLYSQQVQVPQVWEIPNEEAYYFVEDLGTDTLLNWLEKERKTEQWTKQASLRYKKVVQHLAYAQIVAGSTFNYQHAHPVPSFDRQAMLWDLNYFKYYFVKQADVKHNELSLETDFNRLLDRLATIDASHFMFRDFQARNIIFKEETPYFIDYQGGRRGPLQYDLVSLLFQAKAKIPEDIRNSLIEHYISEAQKLTPINRELFITDLYPIALLRNLQTLGAYGLRGLIQQKPHFLQSLPQGIENARQLIKKSKMEGDLPEIVNCISQAISLKLTTNDQK